MNQRVASLFLASLVGLATVSCAEDAPKPDPKDKAVQTDSATGRAVTNLASKSTEATAASSTEITSKQLRMDTEKKIAYFDGDVVVVDPKFMLRANRLVVYLNPNGSGMDRAEAYDDVVIVQEDEDRKAVCQKAVYTVADGKMVLTGKPRILDAKGQTSGEVITINRNTNMISIEGRTQTTISLPAPSSDKDTKPADNSLSTPAPTPKSE